MKQMKFLAIAAGMMALSSCVNVENQTAEEPVDTASVVIENIMTRVSVRQFTEEPVAKADLETILKAGLQAPSAMNAQDWQVRIVTNQEMLNTLSGYMLNTEMGKGMAARLNGKNAFANAPAVAFIAAETGEKATAYNREDTALLSENILLASLSDFPSLMSLQRMFYVAAERVAAPEGQPIDEATPFEYLAPNGSNVLKALWANRESGCIERVQELLGRILDGGGLRLDNDGTRLTLKINSVDDGAFYQPVNVGYGYSYILTLLTAMVLAPKDSFIIVENPEAHLHPSAQAKMMNELIAMAKERKIQLIVETHSDHILNTSLRAVKERKLEVSDLQVLFFSNHTDEEGNMEARVQNLEVNQLGHILNPPKQFFEQYSLDLRALYAPPSRHE